MKVIVGVDDSKFSDEAIRYVSEAVWPATAKFLVLSAAPPIFMGSGEAAAPQAIAELMQQQQQYHREIADRAAARLREAGLQADSRTTTGDPRLWLEEMARTEHADLIVVGSHGRSGIKKILLGSVASHVVTHASCPVLVVKSPRWSSLSADQRTDVAKPIRQPVS